MSDINTVTLSGRLGADLELRRTQNDTAVCDVNLAVTTGYGDKEKTAWIGLVFWGKTAEAASRYLGKGRKVVVSGRLDQDEWDDKETGKKQRKTRVIVENWTFADSEKKDGATTSRASAPSQPASVAPAEPDNDDIPF